MPTPTIITLEPILPVQIVAKAFPEVLAGDVDVSVNGTLYDTETAPGAVNIPITNLNDDSVGVVTPGVGVKVGNSLVIIKKTGGALVESKAVVAEGVAETTIDDSVVVIKDSGGVTLYSKTVKADDVAEQVVNDATVNVRKSDGVLIAAVPVKAQSTEPYNVANSTVTMKDTAGATLDSKSVKATESAEFTAPNATAPIKDSAGVLLKTEVFKSGETRDVGIGDSSVAVKDSGGVTLHTKTVKAQGTTEQVVSDSVLTLNSGAFLNVKAQASQNIQLLSSVDDSPIVPVSVVGPVIKVAPGGGSFNVGLVDRFGNSFGTKPVTANATWDLRTLTPFDYADIFLNLLTAPSSTIQAAIRDLVDDLNAAGLWSDLCAIYPFVNGTSTDHVWNLKYPFNNASGGKGLFQGSPTHNANGMTTNGSNGMICPFVPEHHGQFIGLSIYSRTNAVNHSGNPCDIGGSYQNTGFIRIGLKSSVNQTFAGLNNNSDFAVFTDAALNTQGLFSICKDGSTVYLTRNGVSIGSNTTIYGSTPPLWGAFGIGAMYYASTNNLSTLSSNRNYAYAAAFKAWNLTKEADHYAAVQAFQTALSRQV